MNTASVSLRQIIPPGRFIGLEEILETTSRVQAQSRGRIALVGGAALACMGCPRMTGNVDIAALEQIDLHPGESAVRLPYGACSWGGNGRAPVKIIVRTDEYAGLYRDAVQNASSPTANHPVIVAPEYLAAMKFAVQALVHTLDLKWLLGQPDLVDRDKLKKIIYDRVGGRFAVDAFEALDEEVQLDIAEELDRDECSYP